MSCRRNSHPLRLVKDPHKPTRRTPYSTLSKIYIIMHAYATLDCVLWPTKNTKKCSVSSSSFRGFSKPPIWLDYVGLGTSYQYIDIAFVFFLQWSCQWLAQGLFFFFSASMHSNIWQCISYGYIVTLLKHTGIRQVDHGQSIFTLAEKSQTSRSFQPAPHRRSQLYPKWWCTSLKRCHQRFWALEAEKSINMAVQSGENT